MLIARWVVKVGWQGNGIGAGLLKDAMVRTVNAACKVKGIGLVKTPEVDIQALPEAAILQLNQEEVDELFELLEDSQEFTA